MARVTSLRSFSDVAFSPERMFTSILKIAFGQWANSSSSRLTRLKASHPVDIMRRRESQSKGEKWPTALDNMTLRDVLNPQETACW